MYAKQEYELVFAVVAFMLIFMSEIQHIPGLFLEGIAVLQECFQDDSFPECCHNCPLNPPLSSKLALLTLPGSVMKRLCTSK